MMCCGAALFVSLDIVIPRYPMIELSSLLDLARWPLLAADGEVWDFILMK